MTSDDLTAIPAPERQDDPAFVDSFAQPAFKEHVISLDFARSAARLHRDQGPGSLSQNVALEEMFWPLGASAS